jgi:ParB family chromosome partitioning protein
MIPEFKELFVRGQITIKTARQLGALPEAEQRSLHAAGPPYTPTPRQQGNGHAGGNPVTTPSATASGNGTGESREAPPGNLGIEQAEQARSSSTPAQPTTAGGSRRSSTTKEDGRRKPAELDLDAARSAVRQWLDNALTELDRALPSSADGAIGQSLTEARRHIEAARAALVATPSE